MKKEEGVVQYLYSFGSEVLAGETNATAVRLRFSGYFLSKPKSGSIYRDQKKAVIKCPKAKKAAYKKFLLKKGMKKTITFK